MVFGSLKELGIGYDTGSGFFDNSKPTLVMIHGAGGCATNWRYQIDQLINSFNTIAIDLPGHGRTSGPAMNRIEEYANWLMNLLVEHFPEPVYLMGHSMGGAIVQETAILYPELLKGIILVATGPILKVSPIFMEGFKDRFEETVDILGGYLCSSAVDPELVKENINEMKGQGQKTVFADFSACDHFDRRNDLKKIEIPCLIICGDNDMLTPESLSKKLNDNIAGSILKVLPSAGHMVFLEKPDELNECVREFIE
ncbi:alpha/beta fold hydrolase [Thermodesulfobacteriota bacterium]